MGPEGRFFLTPCFGELDWQIGRYSMNTAITAKQPYALATPLMLLLLPAVPVTK